MELWIRSQNKTELMKVVDLDIYDAREPKTYVIESRGIILGNYKTKERALEVLDEINKVKYYKYMASLDWSSFANGVLKEKPMEEQTLILSMMNTYQMPNE